MNFSTKKAPFGGSVTSDPKTGTSDTEFTFSIKDWESVEQGPINYKIYEQTNNGVELLTQDGWLNQSTTYKSQL